MMQGMTLSIADPDTYHTQEMSNIQYSRQQVILGMVYPLHDTQRRAKTTGIH
jgi:hypothetical protein